MKKAQVIAGLFALGSIVSGAYWVSQEHSATSEDGAAFRATRAKGRTITLESSPAAQEAAQKAAASAAAAPDPLDGDDLEAASRRALEAAEVNVAARDIGALRSLREKLDERSEDGLLAARDDQALDLAIACLSESPDAQQRAQQFFPQEPATQLHLHVRDVCLGTH